MATGALVIAIASSPASGAASTTVLPTVAASEFPHGCKPAARAIRFYAGRTHEWQTARGGRLAERIRWPNCRRAVRAAHEWAERSTAARASYVRWHAYQYDWSSWMPDKWQRIGACETGYGRRPGNFRHSNSSYEGFAGFAKSSWDSFKYRADPKAGPYPEDAWQATPRQQYEVALAIYRAYGFSGWGCRNA